MNPVDALRHHAECRPNSPAFFSGEATWTYERLAAEAVRGLQRVFNPDREQGRQRPRHRRSDPRAHSEVGHPKRIAMA
jgi:hypothetical protein